ncbi:MAG: hypothetical protein HFF29_08770 [Oscillospiraceae bacterium]|nr:hypothetical protein [Oscillospiraceae bacterium]
MTERQDRPALLSVLGDGLLLICALMGFTGSFFSLYGDVSRAGPFLFLAGVFALLSLGAWSLPRFRWAAAGGAAAVLAAVAALRWDELVQGAALTVRDISIIFAQRVSWGRVFEFGSSLPPSQERTAAQLFLLLALALLALALGWAVVRARRWWLAALFTLPPLLPGLLADLYPHWPFFMALCACWCAMLLCDLCKWAAPDRRGALTLTALGCAAAMLAIVSIAFPREDYARPPWALEAEERLHDAANRCAGLFSQWDGPFRSPVTYVGSAEEADLTNAGPLRYTGRTVLRVSSDYEGRLYLRGSSLAVYEDGVWTGLPEGVYQDYLDRLEEEPPFPLTLPTLLGEPGAVHTATIENLGAVGSCAYAPYFPLEQDWREGGMLPVEDAYLARLQGQTKFTVAFAAVEPPEEVGPTVRYQNLVYANYLDVPEELEETLALLASPIYDPWSSIGGGHWRPDHPLARVMTAQHLAQLLAERCEYDPQAPAAPSGTDPVLYFLNDSRRGYCMHYASAATLALRSLGIPARYVSGFTADCAPGAQIDVPDRAAHAWVEIWLNGFGWYPMEVTPAAAFQWYESGETQPSAVPSREPEESTAPQPTPTPAAEPSQAPSSAPGREEDGPGEDSGPSSSIVPLVKALALTAGLCALLWLGQFALKRHRARRLDGPDRNRAALYAYGCLLRLERWGGKIDPLALELAQKARFSRHVLSREELARLRALIDAERARLCQTLGPVKGSAFRWLWGAPAPAKYGENTERSQENTP